MITKIKTGFLFVAIVFSTQLFANDLDKAWEAFNKNDRSAATEFFLSATQNPATAAEAWLGLAYLTNFELNTAEGRLHFSEFYKLGEKIRPEERDAYLYACWGNGLLGSGYGLLDATQISIFKKIAKNSDTNGTLRAMANYMLAKHYQAKGKFLSADKFFKKIGSIPSWSLVGSFDNTSGSGFDKDYGPLDHPQSDAVFVNKYKAEVSWYEVKSFWGTCRKWTKI